MPMAEEKMDLIDEKVIALAQSLEEIKKALGSPDLKQSLDQELQSSSSSESAGK